MRFRVPSHRGSDLKKNLFKISTVTKYRPNKMTIKATIALGMVTNSKIRFPAFRYVITTVTIPIPIDASSNQRLGLLL